MNPAISLLSGLVAAFTPCVIVLFPIVLYRFFSEEKKDYIQYGLFSGGFLLSFLTFAMFLGTALSSSLQNGFTVGLGLLILAIGVLSVTGKINPLNFPLIRNAFLLGAVFAVAVAVNPCSIPYIAMIISLNATGAIVINIFAFGVGMLIPSILFGLIGQSVISFSSKGKSGKTFNLVNKVMSYALIAAGIYMILKTTAFSFIDVYVVSAFMILIFFLLIRSYFIANHKDLKKPGNIILIVASILLVIAVMMYCHSYIDESTWGEPPNFSTMMSRAGNTDVVCTGGSLLECRTCIRCISLFTGSLVLFLIGLMVKGRFGARTKGKKKRK